jgi:hypothetical protein
MWRLLPTVVKKILVDCDVLVRVLGRAQVTLALWLPPSCSHIANKMSDNNESDILEGKRHQVHILGEIGQ